MAIDESLPIGVALLLYTPNQWILLKLRDDLPHIFYPNTWCIFTGGLEESDGQDDSQSTLERAVRREIGEELNVKTNGSKEPFVPQGLTLYHEGVFRDPANGYERRQYTFSSELHVPIELLVLEEGQRLGLFCYEEMLGLNIAPSFRGVIINYFERKELPN